MAHGECLCVCVCGRVHKRGLGSLLWPAAAAAGVHSVWKNEETLKTEVQPPFKTSLVAEEHAAKVDSSSRTLQY